MNSKDAAYQILKDSVKPLHYKEITKRIISKKLWKPEGKTPAATINAQLSSDIKRNKEQSRFARSGKGMYEINWDWEEWGERKPLSFTSAAEHILKMQREQKPMHYKEITNIALETGLILTSGLTPDATMNAQIITEIQRKVKRGETPRFYKEGKGYYSLTIWKGKGLAYQIEKHNKEIRKKFLLRLKKMEWGEFEELIGLLLTAIGFDSVEVTPRRGDGGIDVRGTMVVGGVVRNKMAVQVKRWKDNVIAPDVQRVRGSLGANEQGLIITTSDFSSGARKESERKDAATISLMSGEELVSLLIEHELGIKRSGYEILELGISEESE